MKLAYSIEQQELRESVRRFLADRMPLPRVRELMDSPDGTDEKVWSHLSGQLGLPGIAIPETYGGAGFGFAEQAIVLEELGAALYPGPYLASAVLAANALLASADEAAKQDLLPGIASGEAIATLAFTEDDGSWDPDAVRLEAAQGDGGWLLDGHKNYVLDGHLAGLILVVARAGGERHRGHVEHARRDGRRVARRADQPGWHGGELKPRQRPGLVERGQLGAGQAGRGRVDGEQR